MAADAKLDRGKGFGGLSPREFLDLSNQACASPGEMIVAMEQRDRERDLALTRAVLEWNDRTGRDRWDSFDPSRVLEEIGRE